MERLYTAYIPDLQHFNFSLDHSETIDINNVPLILSMFNMGDNTPSRILFTLFLGEKTRKIALLVTQLSITNFFSLTEIDNASNLTSRP